jgi:hypothetical protein
VARSERFFLKIIDLVQGINQSKEKKKIQKSFEKKKKKGGFIKVISCIIIVIQVKRF